MNKGLRSLRDLMSFIGVIVILGLLLASSASGATACPNAAYRIGSSNQLPDCRSYELVTPPDSNGRRFADVKALETYDLFPTQLFSPSNQSFMFSTVGSSLKSPPGGNGRTAGDVYEAVRSAAGWQIVRHVTPSGSESVAPLAGGIAADHGYLFVHAPRFSKTGEYGSLAEEGSADYLGNSSGTFELTGIGSLGAERLAQGRYISPDGSHVIFSTGGNWCQAEPKNCPILKLEPDAPPTGTAAVYDRSPNGPTHVVSLLPGNVTPAAGEDAEYQGASVDGNVVAFKVKAVLYVRVGSEGETKKVTEEPAAFAHLSDDGRYLVYVVAGNIFRFDTGSGLTDQVNSSGDAKIVNVSADGSHVYFISESQLDAGKGAAGEPNMYVWSGDSPAYVATVLPSDLERTSGEIPAYPALTHWIPWVVTPSIGGGPGADSSRTTPDGRIIVFESRAQLTSYDNAGHTEIYRYDDQAKTLLCASCNPSSAPAAADAQLEDLEKVSPATVIHNLSLDGNRVFFETSEALAASDVDGVNDIYEWHLPLGEGPSLDLISPGTSISYPSELIGGVVPKPNVLLGISRSGGDVFFVSQDALVAGAGMGGGSAIYDARVDGGFPVATSFSECVESNCREASNTAPSLSLPRSEAPRGKGNVKSRKHRCNRKKHRKRGRAHHRCSRKKTARS